MSYVKRRFAVLALAAGLMGAAHAQVPVTVTSNIPGSIEHLESIAKYVEQIEQLQAQYQELQKTYNSLNGLRNVGDLLNSELVNQYLPKDYQQALDALRSASNGEFSGISGSLDNIIKANQLRTCAETATSADARKACAAQWQSLALFKKVGDMGYKQSARNIDNLQTFVNSIKSSSDPKTLQDLQARIAVEQVRMQNEQIKLRTIAMMDEADQRLKQQAATDNFNTGLLKGSSGGFRY